MSVITLLLVEDNPEHAELARRYLNSSDIRLQLHVKETLESAKLWLAANVPDLIISDLRLADGNGVDLVYLAREAGKYPVIIITSQGDEKEAVDSIKAGALDYVVKSPQMYADLPHIVQRALREWESIQWRLKAERDIRLLSLVLEQIQDRVTVTDLRGIITYVNQANCEGLGLSKENLIGKSVHVLGEDPAWGASQQEIIDNTLNNGEWRGEVVNYTRSGTPVILECRTGIVKDETGKPVAMYGISSDITERKKSEKILKESEHRLSTILERLPNPVFILKLGDLRIQYVNDAFVKLFGYSREAVYGKTALELGLIDSENHTQLWQSFHTTGHIPEQEVTFRKRDGQQVLTLTTGSVIQIFDEPHVLAVATDITQWRYFQTEYQKSYEKLEQAEKLARMGNYEIDIATGLATWSKEVFEIFGLAENGSAPTVGTYSQLIHPDDVQAVYTNFERSIRENIPFDLIYRILKPDGEVRFVHSKARVQSFNGDQPAKMFGTLQDITERILIEQELSASKSQIQKRLEQLTILHDITTAITSFKSIELIVATILSHTLQIPEISAGLVLLNNEEKNSWELVSQIGFPREIAVEEILEWGGAYFCFDFHKLVSQCETFLHVDTTHKDFDQYKSAAFIPLVVHDRLKGIFLVLSRHASLCDPDIKNFLHSLAMQTAIAVENAQLFLEMQRKNQELLQAYNATIEAWARTLEMRDKETRGHSDRVSRISMLLAAALQLPENELIDFKRGVLLHDIGKMAIPDNILLKADKLTEREWKIMRQHPTFAYQYLSGIPNLEKAVIIPYCHHEKWNGTGYPRGLKGEEIPFNARIFAIADVWDALTSDRPYRPAWDYQSARQYILSEAGSHFDPQVVRVFIDLLDKGLIKSILD